jgi:hypothetical protein
MRRGLSLAARSLVVALALVAQPARAQTADDLTTLYRHVLQLYQAGKYTEGCADIRTARQAHTGPCRT